MYVPGSIFTTLNLSDVPETKSYITRFETHLRVAIGAATLSLIMRLINFPQKIINKTTSVTLPLSRRVHHYHSLCF
jgi:hypothetical protein